MYDHSDSEDDFPSDARDNDDDDIGEQLEEFRHMEHVEEDERRAHPQMPNQPMASSSSAQHQNIPLVVELPNRPSNRPESFGNALINRISLGVRTTPRSQIPPDRDSDRIRGPATFNLEAWENARLNVNGHVSVRSGSYWNNDDLVNKLVHSQPMKWRTGSLNQLIREACSIPYNQRSLIQRWVVLQSLRSHSLIRVSPLSYHHHARCISFIFITHSRAQHLPSCSILTI
jgi:hypothetical protein